MFVVFTDSTMSNMAYRLRRGGCPSVYVGICILVICCSINYFVRYSIDLSCNIYVQLGILVNDSKFHIYIATLCVKIL